MGVALASAEREISTAGAFLWQSFRWVTTIGMSLIVSAFFYGYTLGQRKLNITRFTLPLHHLPPELAELTLVHISDLHIGPNLQRAALHNYIDQVNALTPDLIFITGDIFDSRHSDIPKCAPILGELRARYGVFAVLGNHDFYTGARSVEEGLKRYTDIKLLRNQHVAVDVSGHRLHLVGLDDLGHDWARGLASHPILSQLLTQVPPGQPTILLSHRPDLFLQAAQSGVSLTLSGHTHGGQIALPRFWGKRNLNLACFITNFDRGLYEREGVFLYVNRGLGVTGQRVRLFTPREIALITLSTN
jgi:predicted MPP superfamily phosphohydrolase